MRSEVRCSGSGVCIHAKMQCTVKPARYVELQLQLPVGCYIISTEHVLAGLHANIICWDARSLG